MVLIGVVPENFAYGFIAVVFTHNPWVGPAMIHFLFYGMTAWAVHRCDVETMPEIQPRCETLLRDMLPYQVIPAWIGVFLGSAFVWAFDFPRLLNFQLFFDHPYRSAKLNGFANTPENPTTGGGDMGTPHNVKPYFWTWLFIVAAMAAGLAIYFYELRFLENCIGEPELTETQHYIAAVALTIVAVVAVLIYVIALGMAECSASSSDASIRRLPDGHRHSAVLNLKYLIFFGLAFTLPAIYDLTKSAIPSPWGRWGLQVALLFVLLVIMWLAGADLSDSYTGDRYLGTLKAGSLAVKLFVFWLLYSVVYLSAPLADTGSTFGGANPPEVRDSVIWVGILGGSLFVLTILVGACYRSNHDAQLLERDLRVATYRKRHLKDDGDLLLTNRSTMDMGDAPLPASFVEQDRLRRRTNASVTSVPLAQTTKKAMASLDFDY